MLNFDVAFDLSYTFLSPVFPLALLSLHVRLTSFTWDLSLGI